MIERMVKMIGRLEGETSKKWFLLKNSKTVNISKKCYKISFWRIKNRVQSYFMHVFDILLQKQSFWPRKKIFLQTLP